MSGVGSEAVDILVVGGGINGAGIARDAAGRGLKVMLVEKDDLASATSSASSKLIHGGLRYLENYEFRLVREALAEREVLLSIAPHITWPLRFVLPHDSSLRPVWMIRAGLFLYDHLAKRRSLAGSRGLDFATAAEGAALKPSFRRGFVYSDGWVQDSRLVVLNARDAAERGAIIRTRCRFVQAAQDGDRWSATIEGREGRETIQARIIVNAAGPWVDDVLRQGLAREGARNLRLVKGSHIVVPRLYEGSHAYILQNPDRRIVFVIPYEGAFTLIGTTDIPYEGEPAAVAIGPDEIAYLCASVNRFLRHEVRQEDVVWSYSGVRPLYDDNTNNPSAVTRDYVFDITGGDGKDGERKPKALSIFGGKITTYRRLAEHAMEKLAPFLPGLKPAWTGSAPLPGGDMPGGFDAFMVELRARYPWLPDGLAKRLGRAYGTRVERILDEATSLADLGRDLGAGLTEAEARYLVANEWALSAQDILWRRSKLGLHGGAALTAALEAWLAEQKAG